MKEPRHEDGLPHKAWTVVAGMAPYARRHRRVFAAGLLAAGLVVAARLALPWPLRGIADIWVGDGDPAAASPGGWHPAIRMGLCFLGLLVVLGLADLWERLAFARFSIAVVRDLRADAFRSVVRRHRRDRGAKPGDMVARLVGDTARIKSGLKTFLVHVLTNSVVFAGVVVVLLGLDLALGLVFAAAAAAAAVVTSWAAARTFRKALQYREKEGRLADAIQQGLRYGPDEARFDKVNRSSGGHEAALTRLQGTATWTTYSVYGLAVLVALWVGVEAVEAGRLQPGDMVVFMLYVVMLRGPIVRLARQGAQTGKILGAGYRVVHAKHRADASASDDRAIAVPPLREALRLSGVVVVGSASRFSRPRLGPVDLDIPVGQRVLVTGDPGSGKSLLLETLAGERVPDEGSVLWDDLDVAGADGWVLGSRVSRVEQDPRWLRKPLRDLVAAGEGAADDLLGWPGLAELRDRLASGLDTRIGAKDVSPGERKLLALATQISPGASVWLLDDPCAGLPDDIAAAALRRLLERAAGATVVVAASRPAETAGFDRVVELRAGRVSSDRTGDGRAAGTSPAVAAATGDMAEVAR